MRLLALSVVDQVSTTLIPNTMSGKGEGGDITSATTVGIYGAIEGFVLSSIFVGGLHQFHKGFRHNVGPSGKVASIVMASTFRFVYDMQQEIQRQNRASFRRQVMASTARREANQ